MQNTVATKLGGILGGDNTLRQLQKEISGMELKKQSLISSVQYEIQTANQKIEGIIHQIGSEVYSLHIREIEIGDRLTPSFEEILSLKQFIAEREEKIKSISSRYDEEIGMLNSNVQMQSGQPQQTWAASAAYAPPAPSPTPGGAACQKCGAPFTPGQDMFCGSCGQRLA